MKIEKIILQNFGPYIGTQELDLSVENGSPVVLILGENMKGKTTLLRALRWVLYGVVHAHDGKELKSIGFANYDALKNSHQVEVSVEVHISDDSEEFFIKRKFVVQGDLDLEAEERRIISQDVLMKPKNGPALSAKDIPEAVGRILHPEIADFFLFDGEMLQDFEEKLRSNEKASALVKSSIEKILGLQSLRLLDSDFEFFRKDFTSELQKIAKLDKKNQEILDKMIQNDNQIRTLEEDFEKLQVLKNETINDLDVVKSKLSAVEAIRDAIIERELLNEQKVESKLRIDEISEQISSEISYIWWAPLSDWIEIELEKVENGFQEFVRLNQESAVLESEISRLRKQLLTENCETCSQKITDSRRDELNSQLTQMEASLLEIKDQDNNLENLAFRRKELKELSKAKLSQLRLIDLDKDLGTEKLKIDSINLKINNLSDVIKDTNVSVMALETERTEKSIRLSKIEDAISENVKELERLKADNKVKTGELAANSGVNSPAKDQLEVLNLFDSKIDMVMERFRDLMREEVERVATEIFVQLSTEPEYKRVRISNKYMLDILDETDRIVERPSAGGQQVLAMSFIGALVRCAVKRGPVMMDTPFGRLDKTHRKNILQWVPTLDTQVLLLVQSGEFDFDTDINYLEGKVSSTFSLERKSASQTIIKKKVS